MNAHSHRQQGSIAIVVAGALVLAMALLGSVQVGYLAYMKRDLQKMVDMAALSGAQSLGSGQSCPVAQDEAGRVAALNFSGGQEIAQPACVVWDASLQTATQVASGANAMQVRASHEVQSIVPFLPSSVVSVDAVAAVLQTATFSIAPRLLRLRSDGLLGLVLRTAGLQPNDITLLDSAGLANASITPAGLLDALGIPVSAIAGVGTPQELARLENVRVAELLGAAATVLDQSGVAQADVQLVRIFQQRIAGSALDQVLTLVGDSGLLLAGAPEDMGAALHTAIDLQQLIGTTLVVANGDHLLDLGLALPLPGVQARLRIVEPPSVAVDAAVGTKISSAGLRLYVHVGSKNIPLAGPLLSTLGAEIDLPLIIEVGQSEGTLMGIRADASQKMVADIDVQSATANVCVGKFRNMAGTASPPESFWSRDNACTSGDFTSMQPHQILQLLGVVPPIQPITLPLFQSAVARVSLGKGEAATVAAGGPNLVSLGQGIADVVAYSVLNSVVANGFTGQNQSVGSALARLLVGPNPGRSISGSLLSLKWSETQLRNLNDRILNGGLLGFLGGTLEGVTGILGALLGTVVAAVVDLLCVLGGPACRVEAVRAEAFAGADAIGSLAGVVIALLQPILTQLSDILNQSFQTLGINLGETDVAVKDIKFSVRLVR